MNKFKVGDWLECVNARDFEGCELTNGRLYQIRKVDETTVLVINDEGTLAAYFVSRFKLYQTQEQSMPMKMYDNSVEQRIKEFLKRLEYVLYHDITVASMLDVNVEGNLYLEGDITTIYGVDDIYTYINNSYDQLTSQAAQKRKQELLDKKAKLDVELAQVISELEGVMMTNGEKCMFWIGFCVGALFVTAYALINVDNGRAKIVQKYKSGEIVCVELNNELICRSAK